MQFQSFAMLKKRLLICLLIVSKKITERTRAVIAVHMFGLPADMDKLMSICNERIVPN